MTRAHQVTIFAAVAGALLLLAGMLFGHKVSLNDAVGVNRSVRDVAIALWAFLLPAWFTLEETWFAPPADQPDQLARFQAMQRKARLTWVIAAGAVAVILGVSAPDVS